MDLDFLEQQAFPTSDFEEIYNIKTACNYIIINKLIYQKKKYFISEFRSCPLMGPNHFGRVPFVLDVSNLFWSGPNYKNLSKKVYFEPYQNNLDPTKSILTRPKQFGQSKIILNKA